VFSFYVIIVEETESWNSAAGEGDSRHYSPFLLT